MTYEPPTNRTRREQPQKSSSGLKIFGLTLGLFAGFALLLLAAGYTWKTFMADPIAEATGHTLDRAEAYLRKTLGNSSQATIREEANLLDIRDCAELALFQLEIDTEQEMNETQVKFHLLTSNKKLRMKGRFRVKVGYDISEGLSLIREPNGQITITGLGEPKILSAELLDIRTVEDQSGLWNKVNSQDRDHMTESLRVAAKREVTQSGLLEQMDRDMRTKLAALLDVPDIQTEPEYRLP